MHEGEYILLLDSSTEVCSVALGTWGGEVVAQEFLSKPQQQSEQLAPMAQRMMDAIPGGARLAGVALSEGPGSYTGLRIGASYAKGLCFALGVPMVSLSTPELMVYSLLQKRSFGSDTLFLPMIDARRMEVYTALYDSTPQVISEILPLVLTDEEAQKSLQDAVGASPLIYFGSGAGKAKELFGTILPQAGYVSDIYPDAVTLLEPAIRLFEKGAHNDVAYWEPFYLKEYEAKRSPNKVLARLKS